MEDGVVRGCTCPDCMRARASHTRSQHSPVQERANELLQGFLTPEQKEDWLTTGGFNVRGKDKKLYRIGGGYEWTACVREDGWGTAVWCQEVAEIRGDNALGLMLYLANNPKLVTSSGCHAYEKYWQPQYLPNDYGGKI